MRVRVLAVLVCVVAGLVASCGGGSSPTAESDAAVSVDLNETPMSAADAAAVDKVVSAVWRKNQENMPALLIGIWDPDKGMFTKAYGDSVAGTPATVDDSLRIGSISKGFTAVVILKLAESGKLSLDQTVEEVAPKVATSFPQVADRTLQDLLGMRSGIPDYLNSPKGLVPAIAASPQKVWAADDLIEAGISLGVKPAGGKGSYSTTNYIVLQEIAEEVTGTSLQQLVADDVTTPLGLTDTFLPPNDDTALPSPALHSVLTPSCREEFLKSGDSTTAVGTDVTEWSASYGQGGGGMTSTLDDLGVWAASGTGDALLSPELVEERNTFAPLDDLPAYGLGVLKLGNWVGHEGEALGWETFALKNSETGTVIALATNSCGVVLQYATIISSLYPDQPLQ